LAKIEHTQFDVLLLDLRLGEADGLSALRRLKEISPNAVGIILTGFGSFDNAIQAVRSGADDFLVKPADIAELKASISRALARRARAEERARQPIREQTARAEAEAARAAAEAARQHLHDLFMQAPAMIAVVRGPEHVVELVNPVYSQAVGLRDLGELVGKPLREVLPELESQEYFRRLDQAYTTGEPYIGHQMPTRIDRRNGRRLEEGYFDVVLQPLRDVQGEVYGIFAYTVDVTEYVRARQRAQELDRLKEEFIETASHDLKSPLTSIRGYTQLATPPRKPRSGLPPDGAGAGHDRRTDCCDDAPAGRSARCLSHPGRGDRFENLTV
jgi:PAS domain S-box-containing protein